MRSVLSFFDPDDFATDPYAAGINQLGHVVLGACLTILFGVYAAAILVAAWELWQYYKRGSMRADTIADVAFFASGIAMAGWLYMPVAAIVLAGTWMAAVWYAMKQE